jgi:hypothetical protein
LVCLVRPHRLALLCQEARQHVDRGIALRHPQNAVMSVGTDCQRVERQSGSKECLPLQFHHSAGDFVEHAANAASHRAASAVHFATASVASASTLSVIEYGSNSIFEVAARYVRCSDQTRLESSISDRRMEVTGHWRLLSRWV